MDGLDCYVVYLDFLSVAFPSCVLHSCRSCSCSPLTPRRVYSLHPSTQVSWVRKQMWAMIIVREKNTASILGFTYGRSVNQLFFAYNPFIFGNSRIEMVFQARHCTWGTISEIVGPETEGLTEVGGSCSSVFQDYLVATNFIDSSMSQSSQVYRRQLL
jgi:hypothetical protein